jgi:two-component system, cell cycle sensor histidine kinase and response regulator CckA
VTASRDAIVEDQPLLAAIVECAQDAIIGCSLDGTILSWNRAAEELYGHPSVAAIGRPLSILKPTSEGDTLGGILARVGEPERVARFDDAHLRADGTLVDVSMVVSPILDASRRVVGASVRACEIGEPDRTDAEFRSLLDSALDAMVVVTGDGTIGLVNAKTETLFGYSREELLGEPVEKLVPERFRGRHRGHRGLYLVNPRARPMGVGLEPSGLHREGREFPLEMSLTPVKTQAGVVVLAAIRDLSERRASERAAVQLAEEHEDFAKKLVETQKLEALGVLAGGIAHDFNNLLGVILGNTSLALQMLPAASPLHPILEHVDQAARRSAELAKQMLAYSGKGMFAVQPVALSELVEGIAELIGGTISKKAVLTSAFGRETPTIEGDVTQLRQVVLNLLTNASEALGDVTGTIVLSTGLVEADRSLLARYELSDGLPAGRYAFLEVADSGSGMDAETRARLFEPFFSTKFVGRGLGLAAVQGIVRGHGGAIRIRSEPGRGTSFKILFPAVAVEAESTLSRVDEAPDWRGSGTVVVADDDDGMRQMATAMLEGLGFAVIPASSGPEALEIVNERDGDLAFVLLDLMMPGMDGEEVIGELEQLQATTPIVLSSGYNTQHVSQQLTGRGVAAFLQKPYDFGDLQAIARKVIGARSRP